MSFWTSWTLFYRTQKVNAHEINSDSLESDLFNELVDTELTKQLLMICLQMCLQLQTYRAQVMCYMYFILYLWCFASFLKLLSINCNGKSAASAVSLFDFPLKVSHYQTYTVHDSKKMWCDPSDTNSNA